MSEEFHFEPKPGTDVLCSEHPTIIRDVVVHHYPPGTPAPPRALPPYFRKQQAPSPSPESQSQSPKEK